MQELTGIDGIGGGVADDLTGFFARPDNLEVLDDLAEELDITSFEAPADTDSPVAGRTIVFTGTLESVTRGEAKAKAESWGPRSRGLCLKRRTMLWRAPMRDPKPRKPENWG